MTPLPDDLPCVTPSDLTGDAPIMVLGPHPDDESLGCGALLIAALNGAGAHVVCLTDGSRSHPGSTLWPAPRLAEVRRGELVEAVRRLGGDAQDVTWLGQPDGALRDSDAEALADRIAALCRDLGCGSLFCASGHDHHADHKAAEAIARRVRDRVPGLRLFLYPVWSRWYDADWLALHAPLVPLRLPGAATAARKAHAIDAHASQLDRVVTDDPAGFGMEEAFVRMFATSDEVYFEVPR